MLTRALLIGLAVMALWAPARADDPKPKEQPAVGRETDRPQEAGKEPKPAVDDAAKPAAVDAKAKAVDPTAVSVPIFMNATCPIMGKPASASLFADVQQGRIYLCCAPCAKKVKKDPERAYEAAYPTVRKAGNTTCPVTGQALPENAPTVVLQGIEIGVATEEAKALAPRLAQSVLARATDPEVTEVGNRTCPVTGEPVAGDAFCLIGKRLVRLSSPTCVQEVEKDPRAVLAKAVEIAAKQSAPTPKPAEPAAPPAPNGTEGGK